MRRTHHCTRCGTHRGPMAVHRKKSGGGNGRPFNLCSKCSKEYINKKGEKPCDRE